jgi:hypothetical protein
VKLVAANNEFRRKRQIIGILSIALMILFYAFEFVGYISFIVWIILVAAVFLIANFALRRLKSQEQQQNL